MFGKVLEMLELFELDRREAFCLLGSWIIEVIFSFFLLFLCIELSCVCMWTRASVFACMRMHLGGVWRKCRVSWISQPCKVTEHSQCHTWKWKNVNVSVSVCGSSEQVCAGFVAWFWNKGVALNCDELLFRQNNKHGWTAQITPVMVFFKTRIWCEPFWLCLVKKNVFFFSCFQSLLL